MSTSDEQFWGLPELQERLLLLLDSPLDLELAAGWSAGQPGPQGQLVVQDLEEGAPAELSGCGGRVSDWRSEEPCADSEEAGTGRSCHLPPASDPPDL